jgi:ribose transport system permease protein
MTGHAAGPFASRRSLGDAIPKLGVWLTLFVVGVWACIAVPGFATGDNLETLLRQSAILGIVAVGAMVVIVAGGLDLSIGAVMALVTVTANGLMDGQSSAIPIAVALALGIGLLVGFVNGAGIVATRVHPLIFTLGTMSIVQGVIFLYTDQSIGSAAPEFRSLSSGTLLFVPTPVVVLLGVAVLAALFLRTTPQGRYVYAAGSDERAARRSGIPVDKIKVATYVFSGLVAAVAGLILAARLGTGYPNAASDMGLTAAVAAIIGGTLLSGGKGTVLGALGGALLLTMLGNVMNLAGISSYVQLILEGAVIIAAIAVYSIGQRDE